VSRVLVRQIPTNDPRRFTSFRRHEDVRAVTGDLSDGGAIVKAAFAVPAPAGGRVCGSLAIRRCEMPQRQGPGERELSKRLGVVVQHKA
jgi:hypothetical protein